MGEPERGLELAGDSAERAMEALNEATQAIAGLVPADSVLQVIVDRVATLVGADYAALGIVDEFGRIKQFFTVGISAEQREIIGDLPRGHGLLGLIIREGRTYRIPSIADHPDSSGFPPGHPPMTSFLGVPITTRGRPVGNLYLTDKRGAAEFSAQDERLVELFARHAGIAIENARVHELTRRMAVIEERDRIGKDLHDGIIQTIYAVGLSLEDVVELLDEDPGAAARRVDRAIDDLHVVIRDIRNFIFGLRPELFEQGDLRQGLAALADQFRLNTMIDLEVSIDPEPVEVAPAIAEQLFQIAREALSNVARHSGSATAEVRLRYEGDTLILEVSDQGQGMITSDDPEPGHFGIANMRARAAAIGGRVAIDSQPGRGTRIIVAVPIGSGRQPAASDDAAKGDA